MKTFVVAYLLLFTPLLVLGQSLQGVVYSLDTDSVIANATVYHNGSLTGTLTNKKGEFSIKVNDWNVPIVVSCVGFYSVTLEHFVPNQVAVVYLKPKVHELGEVLVRHDGMSREEKEQLFKREFLGTSPFALSCTINNLEDIQLTYNRETKTLSAYCDVPIQITNKKLGYKISYYLDSFQKTQKNILISGNYVFQDIIDSAAYKQTLENRRKAYTGSRMAFIRALWHNTLQEEGFKIFTNHYVPIPVDSILYAAGNYGKFISLKRRILITHKASSSKISYVFQTKENAFISSQGFHDASLRWAGPISVKRMGDLLPFEYEPPSNKMPATAVASANENPWPATEPIAKTTEMNVGSSTHTSRWSIAELAAVNAIVLTTNNPLDNRPVVKKWQHPVFYKISGTFGKVNDQRIKELFGQLSHLTGLDIAEASTDSGTNFNILVGGNPQRFKDIVSPEAIEYLSQPVRNGMYYTLSEDGFTQMVLMLSSYGHTSEEEAWTVIKKRLLQGFGFFGHTANEQSFFYPEASDIPDTIGPYDSNIIQALYRKEVRSGMTRKEFNQILRQTE